MKHSYSAGFFDGEGSCSVKKEGRKFLVRVSLGSTDKNIIEAIKIKYKGHIRCVSYDNPKWSDRYDWITGSRNGYLFLKKVIKYLRIKKDIATLCIRFQEECIIGKSGDRKAFVEESRRLNRRGK